MFKKIVAVAIAVAAMGMCFADQEFTEAKNAYVVSAKSVKGPHKDYTQIVNFTDDTDATFTLYGLDKKDGWVKIGTSVASKFGNSSMMDTPYDHKLHKFESFAIFADNGKEYNYTYTKFKIDMYVVVHYVGAFRVTPKAAVLPMNSYAFESAGVKGSFKDRIKIETADGSNKLDGKSFVVYGSQDNENWQIVAGVTVNREGSYCEAVDEKTVSTYKYYAISNREGEMYDYEVKKSHNDLYFVVK